MPDKRTQKLVKEAIASKTIENFRKGNQREKIDVDLTQPGAITRIEQPQTQVQEAEIEPMGIEVKSRGYLQETSDRLTSSEAKLSEGLVSVKEQFDKLLDPNTRMTDLKAMCGTMTHQELAEAEKTAELIKNNQKARSLEQEIKSTEIRLRTNDALLMLQEFEAQIKIARASVKVAQDQDNLEHEIELRSLNQEKNSNDLTHVAETNNLRRENQENYRLMVRQRNEQQAIIRQATVDGWIANAVVATHAAQKKTDWASRLTANKKEDK